LAQEVGSSDIVGLVHIVAEADKRFADRLGVIDRLFELLLFGKIVVGVDADHEGDALGRVRRGARPEGKQAESQRQSSGPLHPPQARRAGDRDGGDDSVSLYRLQLEPPLNDRRETSQN